jgi:succinylglutamate desuccinylase
MSSTTNIHLPNLIEDLKLRGHFLHLSRYQPELFAQPLVFCLNNNTRVSISAPGIIVFEPKSNLGDSDIVLSSGIHGNETAPIEICDGFVQGILRGEITLANRVLFLFGNLPAMNIAKRFITENLNRLFSGAHSETGGLANTECERAKQLEEAVSDFFLAYDNRQRLHYDLHTAIKASKNDKFAVYPFRHGRPWNKVQLSFLLACGINTILLSGSATTTFSYFSSNQFDAEAFTVELGKVKPFGQNDMQQFEAVSKALLQLICGDKLGLKPFDNSDFLIYRVNQVINKYSDEFRFTFGEELANFSDFTKNQLLATDGEREYYTEYDGEAIVFPNANVALGQRAVLTVIPTQI